MRGSPLSLRKALGGPAGLSRVEALFANAQLEAAEDAEATAEAAGATAEAPAAADAAEESEAPTPDVPPSRPLGTGPESPQLPRK